MSADDSRRETPAPGDGDQAALRELALRLILPHYGPGGPSTDPPRIWPGQLPDDLPFELPVPEVGQVIGSYGRGRRLTVLIDTELHPKEIVAWYTRCMRAAGWSTPRPGHGRGGFVEPQLALQAQALFCGSAEGPAITVVAEMKPNQMTHVTLTLNLEPTDNPCQPPADPGPQDTQVGPHLPPLEAPSGSALVGHGMNRGRDLSSALATLTTDLDLTAVSHHYRRQLKEAGWQLDGAGGRDPVAWSAWTFLDRDRGRHEWRPYGRGILAVIREPGRASTYALYLHAHSSEE